MSQPILLNDINEREREVIDLLADELTNNQIAEQLFLAESTVKWYIRQINSKLDTKNREEIVERAQELGLLTSAANVAELPRQNHNLPRQTTPFIGRETELDELYHLLKKPEVRLLTLLAPGGWRNARVRAASEMRCLAIPRDVALGVIESEPAVALAMLREVARRFASALPDD